MEKRQKEILIKQRANLVENLNMRDGLYTQLITRKVLNQRMVRSIQNGRSLDQQAEELLNLLPTRGREAFKHFCDALRDDLQDEIVDLYLETESSDAKDEDKNSVQETASCAGSEESQDSVASGTGVNGRQTEVKAEDCEVLRSDEAISEVSKTVAPVGLSICEEFQQQTYRRSFEPSLVRTSQDSVDSGQHVLQRPVDPYVLGRSVVSAQPRDLDQQARLFYETSILHPENTASAVFSVTNGQRLVMPGSPYKNNIKESVPKSYSPANHLFEKDSSQPHHAKLESPIKENIISKNIPSYHISSSPSSVHHSSPFKETAEQMQHSPYKIHPLSSPLVFHSIQRDLNGARLSERFNKPFDDHDHNLKRGQVPVSESKIQSFSQPEILQRENQLKVMGDNSGSNSDQENKMFRESYLSDTSVPSEPNFVNQREFIELQTHRERLTSGSEGRELFTLPRHVERLFPEKSSEELQNRGGNSAPRLARVDSVDTMNKRPFAEHQEPNAKRLCQKRGISVPELMKPEQLTTLQVYDNVDNQVIKIPVIDEPKLKPSPPVVIIGTKDRHMIEKVSVSGVMDDPEIDLTDGPVNVRVEVSSKQFYLANYKQAYPMRRIPRGKALILNVNEVVGKSPRRGTDIDRDNLHNLLCQLHFDVTVCNDSDGLTAKEMCLKLQQFSQHPGHQDAECTVVCILSHGEEGYIFGADGKKFELDAIFELFDNTSCRYLLGKPKIFIIQACRGGALDKGVTYSLDEHDGSDPKARQVPSMSDMLICYPTQMGYYAWRNRDRGSWYVEALVQVFMKYAKSEDLCTMLNRVNLLVSKKVSHCPQVEMDQMSQMSEYKSTLRMPHLFFFPGIAGDLYR